MVSELSDVREKGLPPPLSVGISESVIVVELVEDDESELEQTPRFHDGRLDSLDLLEINDVRRAAFAVEDDDFNEGDSRKWTVRRTPDGASKSYRGRPETILSDG